MNLARLSLAIGLLLAALPESTLGQSIQAPGDLEAAAQEQLAEAVRLEASVVLDGRLDEAAWEVAPAASDFTQIQPQPGGVPSQRTEVYFLYDDDALYVGARMFDTAPDSILRQMSQRDNFGNCDVFGIWFSPLNDGVNGVQFTATTQGVQIDEKITGEEVDASWNAVWDVVCSIDNEGWSAEFRIPWMAIRFPDVEEQVWGTNFYRHIRRHREDNVWRAMDPRIEGLVNQGGILNGIRNISPPPRISLFPYLSAYRTVDETGEAGDNLNGGMDLKLGLGNAFTLDMTLIPDFGQVVTDNNILNLSPFEIQFEENRPFFTEGLELFNKGRIFYSRRIGEDSNLLNVTKLSGRTAGGTGLGLLQGLARTHADSTLRSYTVAVVDQNLPNNSSISTTGTLVTNEGARADSWAQSMEFNLQDSTNRWGMWGGASLNREIDGSSAEGTDALEGESWALGLYHRMDHFSWTLGSFYESEDFNPNALGYLESPNEHTMFAELEYELYEPFGRFNSMNWSLELRNTRTVFPSAFQEVFVEFRWSMLTRDFQMINLRFEGMPVDGADPFASRIDGLNWLVPRWWGTGGWISTDYRKRVAVDFGTFTEWAPEYGDWRNLNVRIAPQFRFNDRFSISYVAKQKRRANERGFADVLPGEDGSPVSLFGVRENVERTQVFDASYIFTNRMNFTMRLRHSWSQVRYSDFLELDATGAMQPTHLTDEFPTNHYDVNYNAWSIDGVFSWNFMPGSALSVVWKNNLESFTEGEPLPDRYSENFRSMLENGFFNSLSFRLMYFLDYSRLRQGLSGFAG